MICKNDKRNNCRSTIRKQCLAVCNKDGRRRELRNADVEIKQVQKFQYVVCFFCFFFVKTRYIIVKKKCYRFKYCKWKLIFCEKPAHRDYLIYFCAFCTLQIWISKFVYFNQSVTSYETPFSLWIYRKLIFQGSLQKIINNIFLLYINI